MTDLTSLGYPPGYHLGVSSVLWIISIVVIAPLGVFLYLKARKSDMINVKELFRANGSFECTCPQFRFRKKVCKHITECKNKT